MPHLERLALWLISDLLCRSSKVHIRHITKTLTLNVALDIIKKYKVSKSGWRKKKKKARLLNLDNQVITLHLVAAPAMMEGGRELWLIKHPLCAECGLCQKQHHSPLKGAEQWSQKD